MILKAGVYDAGSSPGWLRDFMIDVRNDEFFGVTFAVPSEYQLDLSALMQSVKNGGTVIVAPYNGQVSEDWR